MKIVDGLKLPKDKNNRIEIPNCKRRQFPAFLKDDMGFKRGVEVGVYKGQFAQFFAAVGLELYVVDPWLDYPDYQPARTHYQERQDTLYESARKRLAKYPKVHFIRKLSMDALEDFEDESLDFVYIDAHHGFKYITEDLYGWSKKVRKGGIISGHDYAKGSHKTSDPYVVQVQYVIDAYTKAFKIEKWYVLGSYQSVEGEHRDQYRSWMWIKDVY